MIPQSKNPQKEAEKSSNHLEVKFKIYTVLQLYLKPHWIDFLQTTQIFMVLNLERERAPLCRQIARSITLWDCFY